MHPNLAFQKRITKHKNKETARIIDNQCGINQSQGSLIRVVVVNFAREVIKIKYCIKDNQRLDEGFGVAVEAVDRL